MKKYFILSLSLIFVLSFRQDVYAQKAPKKGEKLILHSKEEGAIPNQYMVMLEDEFFTPFIKSTTFKRLKRREQKAEALKAYKKEARQKLLPFLRDQEIELKSIKKIYAGAFVGFTAVLNEVQIKKLLSLKLVKWIEQDARIKLEIKKGSIRPAKSVQITDWGVEAVGSGEASNLDRIAFVLDTGIDMDHPDLRVNQSLSTSLIASEPDKDDRNGHGTHCAGIIGAKDNVIGTKGVAAGATLVGVKVLNEFGSGNFSDVLDGISYTSSVANPGDVANLSFGARGSQWLLSVFIIGALGNRGIYVTLAAGNSNMHASNYTPANTNGNRIFTISNMMENKHIAPTSNYGNAPVDYAAPGTQIYSTFKDGGFMTLSGTSMAAPHVAGILLLKNGVIKTNGTLLQDKDPIKDKIASAN
ncbi:MAG: S8 family serine peptidase [Bacteroidia bacterium]|nr:S8 family serine peptidase [Bacteroidia bacterium]